MKLPSIFKARTGSGSGSGSDHYSATKPWDWTACKHPKTLSFRAPNDAVFNSIFFDDRIAVDSPIFSNSSATNSTAATESVDSESIETVVRGARSERLFFEPDGTSSILDKSKPIESDESRLGLKESLILSIESANPYEDFRKSMGEMVERYGVRDWDGLEELLGWYLKANWKNNHGFIVGAFVDLLIHIVLASSSSCSNSDSNYYTCTESESFSSYSCVSSLTSMDSKGGS